MGLSLVARDASATEAVQSMMGTAIAFIVINTIFLILRFYTVWFLRTKRLPLTWDDYFLFPSYICVMCIPAVALVMHYYEGMDNPPYTAEEPIEIMWRLTPILKCVWIILILLSVAYACTRYAILAFYLRVFSGRWIRLLSYVCIALITAQAVSFIAATIAQCEPVNYYWDREIEGGTCFDVDKFNKSFTPVNIAFDAVILFMPLPSIWAFRAPLLRKIGYTVVLGMGSFALAASIVRAVVLETNPTTIITPKVSNLEITWLIIEPSLYFITVCMPAMYPLVQALGLRAVRRRTQDKINQRPPFSRLADEGGAYPSGSLRSGKDWSIGMDGVTSDGSDIGTRSRALTDSSPAPPHALGRANSMSTMAMRNMGPSAAEAGEGRILVRTEITITQEDRMEDVMGF